MYGFYELVSGPLVWVACIVFLLGSIWKIYSYISLAKKKDVWVFAYWSWSHAFNSYLHWLIPFMGTNSRREPVMSIITFAFHICLVIVPLFTLGHVVLLAEGSLGLNLPALPDWVSDAGAWIVLIGVIYFAIRRLLRPEVKFVTSASDFVLLFIVAAPFLTGIMAYHNWGDSMLMTSLHMLSGEIMLMAIPFTRLSHMFTFWMTRGYTASEFGAIRHIQDW